MRSAALTAANTGCRRQRVAADVRVPFDNNATERELRMGALARRSTAAREPWPVRRTSPRHARIWPLPPNMKLDSFTFWWSNSFNAARDYPPLRNPDQLP